MYAPDDGDTDSLWNFEHQLHTHTNDHLIYAAAVVKASNHIDQWFSNYGARPPMGAQGAWKGGAAYFPTDKN
jgi:hypothetical protein